MDLGTTWGMKNRIWGFWIFFQLDSAGFGDFGAGFRSHFGNVRQEALGAAWAARLCQDLPGFPGKTTGLAKVPSPRVGLELG